jgi:hypothetical protein
MSENEHEQGAIEDDDLPEELQPTDDNPLARDLDEDDEQTKSREELDVLGGKTADEDSDDDSDD